MIKLFKKILYGILSIVLIFSLILFIINIYVLKTGEKNISDFDNVKNSEYILVFGASVHGNTVSYALSQRLDAAYMLYKKGCSKKIIVSGDHQSNDYNEVQAMKDYLVDKGIPEGNIIMDHSGVDTFVSVSRLKKQINPESVIFVTQMEHLKRALYYAKKLNVNASGVACEDYSSEHNFYQMKREFLARIKAFIVCDLFKNDIDYFNKFMKLVDYENFD